MEYGQLKPDGYIPRIADRQLERMLATFGAVEVAGGDGALVRGGLYCRALRGSLRAAARAAATRAARGHHLQGRLARSRGSRRGECRVPRRILRRALQLEHPEEGLSSQESRRVALSLARNLGTAAKLATVASDAGLGEADSKSATNRAAAHIAALQDLYVVEQLTGWDAPILYLSIEKSTLCHVDYRHSDNGHADAFLRPGDRVAPSAGPTC